MTDQSTKTRAKPLFQAIQQHLDTSIQRMAWPSFPLDPELAATAAVIRDNPVSMVSRAWTGGPFRVVRETLMSGAPRIQVYNLVAYPHTEYDLPVFATDIVVLAGRLRIAVIDAMPIFVEDAAYRQQYIEPFNRLSQRASALGPEYDRKLEWSKSRLGPAASMIAGMDDALWPSLEKLWQDYWDTYLELAVVAKPCSGGCAAQVKDWHRSYNLEHAEVELKRNPLMRYYGEDFGRRFILDFLFSDSFGLKDSVD